MCTISSVDARTQSAIDLQAMSRADPQAKWLMQAWLFYDNQEFWKPPQIKVSTPAIFSDFDIKYRCL